MKQKIFYTLFAFLLLLQQNSYAQLYEISLKEQVEKSSLVIEGVVSKSKSFIASNREIFTAHEIKISKTFKGDELIDFVTIITRGGTAGGMTTTWTHLLTLQEGQEGVFFLKNTLYPMIQDDEFSADYFDVYSSSQGFYQYHTLENKNIIIANPFNRYEHLNELYKTIQDKTGQSFTSKDDDRNEKRTGIRYVFKNFEIVDNIVNFDVYVNGLYNDYELYQSGIIVGYNSFFGQNVAANEYAQIESITSDIANPLLYNLTMTDYSENNLMFKLDHLGGEDFSEIKTYEKPFAKGRFQIVNPIILPDIQIDESQIASLNRYHAPNTFTGSAPFDTVIVDLDLKGLKGTCFPLIDSFTPDTVAAGIGQILTIRGECFGDYEPYVSRVEFLNARRGFQLDEWASPVSGDYECI